LSEIALYLSQQDTHLDPSSGVRGDFYEGGAMMDKID
tara:strand:- start:382 stop:492 length:111 start_codon:yes stop_codon:yes gene_type:complete